MRRSRRLEYASLRFCGCCPVKGGDLWENACRLAYGDRAVGRRRARTSKNEKKEGKSRFNSTKREPEAKERRGRTKRLTRPGQGRGGRSYIGGRAERVRRLKRRLAMATDHPSTLITPSDSGLRQTKRTAQGFCPPSPTPANPRTHPRATRMRRPPANGHQRDLSSSLLATAAITTPTQVLFLLHRHLSSFYYCTPKAKILAAVHPFIMPSFGPLHPHQLRCTRRRLPRQRICTQCFCSAASVSA